jgi:hypothetical protein
MQIGTARIQGPSFLIDTGFLTLLGIGAYKRQVWAGYGLIALAALDGIYKLTIGFLPGVIGGLLWIVLFTNGTIHLSRLKRFTFLDIPTTQWSGKWVYASWITAFVSAFLQFVIALQQPTRPFGYLLIGFILVGLGIGVYRGDHRLAWGLVGLQFFNTVATLAQQNLSASSILVAILSTVVMFVYIKGALQLRTAFLEGQIPIVSESQSWARILYEIPFLHAASVCMLILLFLRSPSRLEGYVDLWGLIDVAILVGLGFMAYKQWLWGAYALVLYQLFNVIYVLTDKFFLAGLPIHLSILALYVTAIIHLRRLKPLQPANQAYRETDQAIEASLEGTASSTFTYMCPNCHSFQHSDTSTCNVCNAENPHRVNS